MSAAEELLQLSLLYRPRLRESLEEARCAATNLECVIRNTPVCITTAAPRRVCTALQATELAKQLDDGCTSPPVDVDAVIETPLLEHCSDTPVPTTCCNSAPGPPVETFSIPENVSTSIELPQELYTSRELQQEHCTSGELPQQNCTSSELSQEHSTSSELPQEHSTSSELPQEHSTSSKLPQQTSTCSELPQEHSTCSELPQEHSTGSELLQEHSTGSELPQEHSTTNVPDNNNREIFTDFNSGPTAGTRAECEAFDQSSIPGKVIHTTESLQEFSDSQLKNSHHNSHPQKNMNVSIVCESYVNHNGKLFNAARDVLCQNDESSKLLSSSKNNFPCTLASMNANTNATINNTCNVTKLPLADSCMSKPIDSCLPVEPTSIIACSSSQLRDVATGQFSGSDHHTVGSSDAIGNDSDFVELSNSLNMDNEMNVQTVAFTAIDTSYKQITVTECEARPLDMAVLPNITITDPQLPLIIALSTDENENNLLALPSIAACRGNQSPDPFNNISVITAPSNCTNSALMPPILNHAQLLTDSEVLVEHLSDQYTTLDAMPATSLPSIIEPCSSITIQNTVEQLPTAHVLHPITVVVKKNVQSIKNLEVACSDEILSVPLVTENVSEFGTVHNIAEICSTQNITPVQPVLARDPVLDVEMFDVCVHADRASAHQHHEPVTNANYVILSSGNSVDEVTLMDYMDEGTNVITVTTNSQLVNVGQDSMDITDEMAR